MRKHCKFLIMSSIGLALGLTGCGGGGGHRPIVGTGPSPPSLPPTTPPPLCVPTTPWDYC